MVNLYRGDVENTVHNSTTINILNGRKLVGEVKNCPI